MSKLKSTKACLLLVIAVVACQGCGEILGPNFPVIASPRVIVATPASPASDKITIRFQLVDREKESGDVTVEYSTDGAQTFQSATLTATSQVTGLASEWHPGIIHTVQWDSVTDMVGISGDAQACVRVTPSDASNPSGTADITGTFTVDNLAFNQRPSVTVNTPAGVQSGNVQITYTLTDTEGDTCSIVVEFSIDGGAYQAATMGPAGDGLSGLPSSPGGTQHTLLWDSRTDNVGPLAQQDNVRIRITPGDFHTGTAVSTNPFSVDNSVPNNPPTVSITSGPSQGSTVYTPQVTFVWNGNDTDGFIDGYYYSFDRSPPDVWTASTSVTSGILMQSPHTFRVIAMDDEGAFSTVASRTFTVSTGFIQANFSASPLSGTAPLPVQFTDLSTSTSGITSWSWSFGDGGTSTSQNPSHVYSSTGSYTVTLTVAGPDGSDTETKASYITVTSPGGSTIYVDGTSGNDTSSGFSWAQAVRTIQTGLDKAGASGWSVLVANGTYTGTGNKNLDFTGKAIHLKSTGAAANCIIDCQNDGRAFHFNNGETTDAIVDGFTIKNGATTGAQRYTNCGAAILCEGGAATITNCIIKDCASTYFAGAIQINQPIIVSNCIIANNSADYGGAFYAREATANGARIVNCTIVNNTYLTNSGCLRNYQAGTIYMENCIIWNNDTRSAQVTAFSSTVTMDYTDYQGGWGGTGNLNVDPQFVDAGTLGIGGYGDYHLQVGSPCIDAGDNSLVPGGVTTDLDGNARIANTTVDIGAYEYGSSVEVTITLVGVCDTPGDAHHLSVVGNYAYVADKTEGVQIIDISNPSDPQIAGSIDPGQCQSVFYGGGPYAYAASVERDFYVVDVQNPSNPTLTGQRMEPSLPERILENIFVQGPYAYLSTFYSGYLYVVDVSSPVNPQFVGSLNAPGAATDVWVSGSYAYLADGYSGLTVVDVSDPTSPTTVRSLGGYGHAWGIYGVGSRVYISTDNNATLEVFDTSDPAYPVHIGGCTIRGRGCDVCVDGNYAFTANDSGLDVIDVSNPFQPVVVAEYVGGSENWGVCAHLPYVYLVEKYEGLKIFEISY